MEGRHVITIGIDPHKASLTAVALDQAGQLIAMLRLAVTGATVAVSISLNAITSPAAREPGPPVIFATALGNFAA